MNKSSKFNTSFRTFCKQTTAHGFGNVAKPEASNRFKIFWTVLLVVAMLLSAAHVIYLTLEYLRYPTREKVFLSDNPPTFPSVTVCNKNPIRSGFDIPTVFKNLSRDERIPIYELLFENADPAAVTDIGHKLSEFILGCWKGNSIQREACDEASIQLYQTSKYFNCYTIPGGYPVSAIGQRTGLTLLLFFDWNTDIDEESHAVSEYFFYGDRVEEAGGRLEIHAPGTLPNPRVTGIDILPGHLTTITLKENQRKKLGPPYSDCTDIQYLEYLDDYKYSTKGCLDVCKARHIRDVCNCTSSYWPVLDNVKDGTETSAQFCRNLSKIPDYVASTDSYYCDKFLYLDSFKQDACGCKEHCEYSRYTVSESLRQWPGFIGTKYVSGQIEMPTFASNDDYFSSIAHKELRALARNIYTNTTHQETAHAWMRKKLARVEIDFSELSVDVMQEERLFTLPDLFAAIGGALGLYVGLSLVTFIEFVVFPFQLFKRNRKQREENDQQSLAENETNRF